MPIFVYQAITKEGEKTSGELKVETRQELTDYIERQGLLLVSVKEQKERKALEGLNIFGGGISLLDRYFLFSNFNLMLMAGLSGFESINILEEDAKKKTVKKVLADVRLKLEQGRPFSEGFAEFPDIFSTVTVNLLKAGESSGTLDQTTNLIAAQYKKESDVRKKITSAMIYPAILFIGSASVIVLLLAVVVPRLAKIFVESNVPLHPITKITLAMSRALSNPVFDIAFLVFGAGILLFLFRARTGKKAVSFLFFKFPVLRSIYRHLNLYRFCWTLGALIGSGVGILEAMDIVSNVLTGTVYREAGLRVKDSITKGFTLGQSLKEEKKLFPAMVSGMATVGEQTGNFEKIFMQLGDFYEEAFDNGLKTAITLLEPLLLLAMGLMVGVIAISVVLPIYALVTGVK